MVLDRIMDELAKVRSDFVRFNELVFGPNPDGRPPVHAAQAEYFYDTLLPKYCVLVCGNSWGKTELIARMHVYYCLYKQGMKLPPRELAFAPYNTLNCAYTYEVSEKEFTRITRLRSSSEVLRAMIDKIDNVHRKIYFKNGSTFTAGSTDTRGKLIEGERYALITVEEAGYEKDLRGLMENVIIPRTMVPNVPGGGKIHLIGTPKPFSDPYYYSLFLRGQDESIQRHYSRRGSVYENEFLSAEDIKRIEDDFADSPVRDQVIHGEFVAEAGTIFTYDMIFSLFNEKLERHEEPVRGRKYLVSVDLARKKDKTVATVVDFTDHPLLLRVNAVSLTRTKWSDVYDMIRSLYERFSPRGVIVDETGIGDVVRERIEEMGIPVDGVVFRPNVKEAMILCLQDAMSTKCRVPFPYSEIVGSEISRSSILSYPDRELESELNSYRWNDSRLSTDNLMSLAMAVYYLQGFGIGAHANIDYVAQSIKRR